MAYLYSNLRKCIIQPYFDLAAAVSFFVFFFFFLSMVKPLCPMVMRKYCTLLITLKKKSGRAHLNLIII